MKAVAQTTKDYVYIALRSFLSNPKPGVLALKGPWGVGKTYIWNKFFEKYKKDASQVGYAYVSLFGIGSIAELRRLIFAKHEAIASKREKWLWQKTKKYSYNLFGSIDLAPATKGVLKNTEIFSEWFQDKLLRNFIICIDDLERKEESLTGSALLGFITSLREERKCKVVLIYNDDAVPAELNECFGEYREKVIDAEITYSPSVADNFLLIFSKGFDAYGVTQDGGGFNAVFGEDNRTLLQLFECLRVTNIRVLQKTKDALDYFAGHLRSQYPKLCPQFLRQIVKICCLYYIYGDRWSVDELIRTGMWVGYYAKAENDPEKVKQRALRQPIRDIGYSQKPTDVLIAQYLKDGYVDWNLHASLLVEAEEYCKSSALNAENSKLWTKFHGNFTTPQDVFISEFREFIKKNWRDLRLQEVDAGVSFLQHVDANCDLSDVLYQKIASFVEEWDDSGSLHLHLHNVNPATVERVKDALTANVKNVPIDAAVEKLTKEGGWTPSDVKYLAHTTSEQFYDFLKSSEKAYFLSAVKELRHRLGGSEGGKPILDALDEALRRIAKRSKLDELRVLQTEVELAPKSAET